ncbi:MAG: nucleotide exchange factor GrpE, partial [Treponema sp.]|nr:nucleotide exchange factor GrpE [Treponema sp.]
MTENEQEQQEFTEQAAEPAEDSQEQQDSVQESQAEPGEQDVDSLRKQIESLTAERDDYKDKYLRSAADFQNLRKRSIQEKQEAFDYGNAALLKDLLDSLDNFDRTVEAAGSATDAKSIADGVRMINKSLVSMLEAKYNL